MVTAKEQPKNGLLENMVVLAKQMVLFKMIFKNMMTLANQPPKWFSSKNYVLDDRPLNGFQKPDQIPVIVLAKTAAKYFFFSNS